MTQRGRWAGPPPRLRNRITRMHPRPPASALAVILTLAFGLDARSAGAVDPPPSRTWRVYGGNREGTRYSALDQVHRGNVAQLEVAWSYDPGEEGGLQTNPIVV